LRRFGKVRSAAALPPGRGATLVTAGPARDTGGMATDAQAATVTPPKHSRWQFSLTTLFAIVTFVAAILGALHHVDRQRRSVAAIRSLGGRVFYVDMTTAKAESWLERWLPEDWVHDVKEVWLIDSELKDSGLVYLQGLDDLQEVWLSRTETTDIGLENLEGLHALKWLHLGRTQVTDAGLASLRGMTNLRSLYLTSTLVTDAGLVCMECLN
jgi:hypothetical protein